MDAILCCADCFDDRYLKAEIEELGGSGYCNFCKNKRRFCVSPNYLYERLKPLLAYYKPYEGSPLARLTFETPLWEILCTKWKRRIFNSQIDAKRLLFEIFKNDIEAIGLLNRDVIINQASAYWTGNAINIEKWQKFIYEIRYNNRFFPSKGINTTEIKKLLKFTNHNIKSGEIFYRARKGNRFFEATELGKPPKEMALNGRANPFGISYLYLASDEETAIKEICPYVNQKVTIGKFKAVEKLAVADLRSDANASPFKFKEKMNNYLKHWGFIICLSDEMSQTRNRDIDSLGTIQLQYLCEFAKKIGYKGVVYDSSISEGYNLMVFDGKEVEVAEVKKYRIKYREDIMLLNKVASEG